MKKKIPARILSFLLLAISMLTLLTGCVRSGVGIVVNPDDTGDVELSFGISKEYYQMVIDQYGTELYEGKETFELKDGDTTYICMSEHKPFGNLDELKQILLELEYTSEDADSLFSLGEEPICDCDECTQDDCDICDCEECPSSDEEATDTHIFKSVDVIKNDGFFETTYHVCLVTNAFPTSNDELSLYGIDTENFYKVLVSVTLPGTVKAEGATLQDNTASFKLTSLDEETTLTVDSSSVDTVRIVALVVAVIIVVLLIAMFAKPNKKKANKTTF